MRDATLPCDVPKFRGLPGSQPARLEVASVGDSAIADESACYTDEAEAKRWNGGLRSKTSGSIASHQWGRLPSMAETVRIYRKWHGSGTVGPIGKAALL
jgi:hypothetical protein